MNNDLAAVKPAFIETDPIGFVSDDAEVAVEAARYIYFPGDLIDPKRKRQVKRLKFGGEELEPDYRCFSVTRGHVWRNMFVPMTRGYRYEDPQQVTEEQAAQNTVVKNGKPTVQLAVEPGVEIRGLLFGKSDLLNKGFIEVKALRGIDWAEMKRREVQKFFFPDWDEYKTYVKDMPYNLMWTRRQVEDRAGSTSETFFHNVAEDCLTAIENTYAWGIDRLKVESTLVKTPPPPGTGFVFRYSELAEQLFGFLDQQRDDFLRQDFGNSNGNGGVNNADLQRVVTQLAESQALIVQLLSNQQGLPKEVVAKAEELVAEQPVVSTKPVTPTVTCAAIKKNNEPCNGLPMGDTPYCVFHQEK